MALSESTFLILSALAGGALHGYGVVQQVQTLSDGRVRLSVGTLYRTLDRLAEDGLVRMEREEVVGGRLRRYYQLTDGGAATLDAEVHRMRQDADMAAERLRARASGRPGWAPSS